MKKILFAATVDSHINHFHLPYLKLFKDKGYEVHVATNTDEPIKYCDVKHKISFERSPFKINNLKAIKQLKKVLDEEKFDVIHCHTPMGSVVTRIAAISTRKVNNTRVIYTAHGFHFYKGASIVNWLLFYPIEKWLSKYTDTLITINNEDYELAKRKFKSENIELVNGIGIEQKKFNFELSEKEKNNLRKSIGLTPDDFVIIYVAELNKRKNQKMALKAIESLSKKHSNIKLMLIGKDSLNFYYQKLAKKLKIENNIKFLGYRSDIPKLIKISNLAISTAKQEGLPVNIMEYMLCNLPIIATNCRGNRDLVKNTKNGFLVEINDYLLMAEKIEEKYKEKNINGTILECKKEDLNKYLLNNVVEEMKIIYKFKTKNEPIRVLQIVRSMNFGGAETLIMNLYRNIDRTKVQFDFLVSRKGYFDEEITSLGGRIHIIPYLTDKGQMAYVRNLKTFFIFHSEYKIIHSHIDQVTGIIVETAKKSNVPVRISHSHNTKNSNNLLGKIYKVYLQNKINKNATDLFACSELAAKWLFKNKASEAIIINNGVDVEKFKFSKEKRFKIRNELNIPEDYYIIGHVGAFRIQKNHAFLVDLFNLYLKQNPKTYLILVGDGELRKKIEEKAYKLGIAENVKFLGIRTDVDYLYSAFDVLCYPSFYEGLSLALVEAQISGLYVVTSNGVDKQTDISNNIKFLDLKNNIDTWIENIKAGNRNIDINIHSNLIKKYDIKDVAKNLEKKYLELKGDK